MAGDLSKPRAVGPLHDCEYASDPRVNESLAASLKEKNVLITGAGRGIGRATAEFFAHTSASSLSLVALELEEVEETARICKAINGNLQTKAGAFDITEYDPVETFVQEAVAEFGSVDVLFANAGRPPQFLQVHESDPRIWWDTVAVSLQGSFNFSRAVLPFMRKKETGTIIFTSSGAAQSAAGMSSYTLAKLSLIRLAETVHNENRDYRVKAFAIHPGTVRTRFFTDFQDAVDGQISGDSYVSRNAANEEESAKTAVGFFKNTEWDTPQMPAGLVVVLASGQLDFMSGRYVDASRKVEEYLSEKATIQQRDLHRIRLIDDVDSRVPHVDG